MYGPFYQPSPFFQPPDNQSTKNLAHTPGPPAGNMDYNKPKEQSPLDLINKLQPSKSSQNESSSSNSSNSANSSNTVGKMMQHYQHYPYK